VPIGTASSEFKSLVLTSIRLALNQVLFSVRNPRSKPRFGGFFLMAADGLPNAQGPIAGSR